MRPEVSVDDIALYKNNLLLLLLLTHMYVLLHEQATKRPPTNNACTCSKPTLVTRGCMDRRCSVN